MPRMDGLPKPFKPSVRSVSWISGLADPSSLDSYPRRKPKKVMTPATHAQTIGLQQMNSQFRIAPFPQTWGLQPGALLREHHGGRERPQSLGKNSLTEAQSTRRRLLDCFPTLCPLCLCETLDGNAQTIRLQEMNPQSRIASFPQFSGALLRESHGGRGRPPSLAGVGLTEALAHPFASVPL